MNRYFADAGYFIALASPRDQWHADAVRLSDQTLNDKLITTEEVLIELLNFYAESGEFMRRKVYELTNSLLIDPRITIVSRGDISSLDALELYGSRLDKGYSLTDCVSMNVCRTIGLNKVIANDDHFAQAGFISLM